MADDSQQPERTKKRPFDDFDTERETRYRLLMPAPKVPCLENDFDHFLNAIDNPDLRTVLEMSPPGESTAGESTGVANYDNPMGLVHGWGNENASGEHVLQDPTEYHQEELAGAQFFDFFGQTTDLPLAAEASETSTQDAPLITTEGKFDFQVDPIELDGWTTLPELHYSPLPDYDSPIAQTVQSPSITGESSTTRGGQARLERWKKLGCRSRNVEEIVGFPPSSDPLPPDLTLEQICWSYPNHLINKNLRPFIEAGWNGQRIWNTIQEAAKVGKTTSSKFIYRLRAETIRMELEGLRTADKVQFTAPQVADQCDSSNENASETAMPGTMDQIDYCNEEANEPIQDLDWMFQTFINEQEIGAEEMPVSIDGIEANQTPVAAVSTNEPTPVYHPRGRLTRMFPYAPSTDVVLTEQDMANLENILDNFPEHLSLHHVMERFLRPEGAETGDYPRKELIARLRVHHNAKHGSDLNHPDRDKGVAAWVKAKRDSAMKARLTQARRRAAESASANKDIPEQSQQQNFRFVHYYAPTAHADAGAVYPGVYHNFGYHFVQGYPFTGQPYEHKEDMSTAPQISSEQVMQVPENETPPEFGAPADPWFFEQASSRRLLD